jgi:hypothetical protein
MTACAGDVCNFCGMGLVVYELAGKLSRAFSSSALAAFMMAADVFGRTPRVGEPGLRGNGGGARSGSALSHLKHGVSGTRRWVYMAVRKTNMGIILSCENECECLTSSRSRETSLSDEGIMVCGLVCAQPKMVVVRWRVGAS